MITKNYTCRKCGSENIVKNGHNGSGSPQYWCKDCNTRGVLEPNHSYTEAQKEQIIAAYHERPSMRGIARIFGISPATLASWLKKRSKQPKSGADPSSS
jgi:transposase-like protein